MANEPLFNSGDLCRATIHDNPSDVAWAMRVWFDTDRAARQAAVAWLTTVAIELADG